MPPSVQLLPLDRVRVVSVAQNVPGPLAVARLAALGARAHKVEPPGGDPLATMCRPWYDELHAGVTVERIDLKTPEGRQRMLDTLADTELLVTSQRPSALKRLSLDRERLAASCPRVRILRIVGALDDPETPGHDLTYQARAGLLARALPPSLVADVLAAERAVSGALTLLSQPPGSSLDIGVFDSLDALIAPRRHGLTTTGGLLGGGLGAYGVYPASTGWVAVAALEPHFRTRLFDELGIAPEGDLAAALRTRSATDWEEWARARDLPLAALQ